MALDDTLEEVFGLRICSYSISCTCHRRELPQDFAHSPVASPPQVPTDWRGLGFGRQLSIKALQSKSKHT